MNPLKGTKNMRKVISIFLALCLIPAPVSTSVAVAESMEEKQLVVGDILSIPVQGLSRVSITDPQVADISDARPEEVTVMGKAPGQTVLFLWDELGKKTVIIRTIAEDLTILRSRIESLLKSAEVKEVKISESAYEGKLVMTGALSEEKAAAFERVIAPFSDNIINLVTAENIEDLVQIDMQVTELGTTLTKEFGIDWSTAGFSSVTPVIQESSLPQTGKFFDSFKLGDFNRTNGLIMKINALIQEGKARILSKPRLVVKNGKEATFLVGGEVPIRTTTTNSTGGASQENVEFKEYGVSMAITPTIRNGKVDILLNVEISDIDASRPTGDDLAFLTRSAQTQLFLDDRQTIVLAGLIKKRDSKIQNRVPVLGSIPIIGLLFRSTRTPSANEDTEVVISLTPTIIKSSKPVEEVTSAVTRLDDSQAPMPAEEMPAEEGLEVAPAPAREEAGLPAISKNPASMAVNVPEGVAPYAQLVQERISSSIAYPYEAQQNGWQGTVKLSLVLKRDGTLQDVYVKESSGYEVFDQDAVHTAQILAPYAPFPANIEQDEISLNIPIVYSLDSFLKNVAKRN